jgi:hypothetical protein
MEDVVLSIVKELLAISIGFVGLIFAAFSILMTLSDEHWKIKMLRRSQKYKIFIGSLSNLGVGFLLFFILSIIILILEPILKIAYPSIIQYILYIYIFALISLVIKAITILNKFKKIVILFSDSTKPTLEMNDKNDEE